MGTFFVALAYIGILTGFVADIAGLFGCLIGLPDTITAITFVALGTSLPDTFASKTAAINDKYADASVGNVTGSNSVNVFLGLGLPWLIATIAHSSSGFDWDNEEMSDGKLWTDTEGTYGMEAGDLAFSVVLFCICAILCIGLVYVRRFVGQPELGGSATVKSFVGCIMFGLWIFYVIVSSLVAKKKMDPWI